MQPQLTPPVQPDTLRPRRIVLLDESGEVTQVLATYEEADMSGKAIHTEVQKFAKQHAGQAVALEWLSKLRWERYVVCRK